MMRPNAEEKRQLALPAPLWNQIAHGTGQKVPLFRTAGRVYTIGPKFTSIQAFP